ncbi:hypothetical protein BGZ94_006103, partial [Podila epigama]
MPHSASMSSPSSPIPATAVVSIAGMLSPLSSPPQPMAKAAFILPTATALSLSSATASTANTTTATSTATSSTSTPSSKPEMPLDFALWPSSTNGRGLFPDSASVFGLDQLSPEQMIQQQMQAQSRHIILQSMAENAVLREYP